MFKWLSPEYIEGQLSFPPKFNVYILPDDILYWLNDLIVSLFYLNFNYFVFHFLYFIIIDLIMFDVGRKKESSK